MRVIDTPRFDLVPLGEHVEEVARWLGDPLNYKWLDFGFGRQILSAAALRIMKSSPAHLIRVVCEPDGRPVGVIGLQYVNNPFGAAMVWAVRPRLRPPARGRGSEELERVLEIGFGALGLKSVHAWVVECNRLSCMAMRHAGFRESGRMRKCHLIGDALYDRILFDMTAEEWAGGRR